MAAEQRDIAVLEGCGVPYELLDWTKASAAAWSEGRAASEKRSSSIAATASVP